jgi:hypothetical protein
MGLTRFLVPRREFLPAKAAERAYISGMDDIPWRTRVTVAADVLSAERAESESGNFHILWKVAGRGDEVLSTATLIERLTPYILPLELARGILNRVRANLAAWEAAGLPIPPAVAEQHKRALADFVAAVARQGQPAECADHAQQAIVASLAAADSLIKAFADQAARARAALASKPTILFGGSLDAIVPDKTLGGAFAEAFNTAIVPLAWNSIESHEGKPNWTTSDGQIAWCQAHQLRIFAGPVLELHNRSLPDWLFLWEGDFDHLVDTAAAHVKATVSRYKGRVHLWHCAARVNTVETLSLSEEESLRLTIRAIEVVRETDPRAPIVVSFDQPWSEYMSRRDQDLSPLQYADTLVRADIGVAGIGLELNLGVGPNCTLPRDLIEVGRQIERWTMLGLPLVIFLTIPSQGDDFTPHIQRQLLEGYLELFSAKSAVHAIFWPQLRDLSSGDEAHRGLVDSLGQPNAVLATLSAFRKRLQF